MQTAQPTPTLGAPAVSAGACEARVITSADIWSAIRGLGMHRMTAPELDAVIATHTSNRLSIRREGRQTVSCAHYQPFASRVIAEAARQVLTVKRRAA